MKYYVPQIMMSWKLFEAEKIVVPPRIVPYLGDKFCPVYISEEQCRKFHPGVTVIEIDETSSPTVVAKVNK